MGLASLQRHWQALGEQDPLWAILTSPGKRGGAWDLDEFLATGQADVSSVLGVLSDHRVNVKRGRALDFGCGVGRLTQALADHFDECDGVDLATSMIEYAVALNERADRVRFHHNDASDLRLFEAESFDFVISLLVLQHMEAALMRGYLSEFVRVLRPGGVAYFNVPERAVGGVPLSPDAWRAGVRLSTGRPAFSAGRAVALELLVRNDSGVPWPASAWIQIGYHWRMPDGEVAVLDGGRTLLDTALRPGQECPVRLDVVAPGEPGEYVLEIDLVQEPISWFSDLGSPTLRLPVTVATTAGNPAKRDPAALPTVSSDWDGFTPTIEMHAMDGSEVAAAVEAAGGTVLAAIPTDRCGPWFPSVDYIVTPRANASPRLSTWFRRAPLRRS